MQVSSGEMHWSLMPLHACLSTVRPSSFVYGYSTGYNYKDAASFPVYASGFLLKSLLTRNR